MTFSEKTEFTGWQKEAIELREKGMQYAEIQKRLSSELDKAFPGETNMQKKEHVRYFIRKCIKNGILPTPVETKAAIANASVEMKPNGERVFEGIITLMEGEPITPEVILQAHNLEPNEWEVLGYKSNFWQSQAAEGKTKVLYQSKISVKPRTNLASKEDIDEWFTKKNFGAFKPLRPFAYNESKEILEIDYTDLHVGLLSWAAECGTNFDLSIIKERFEASVADVVERCRYRKFKLIRFITLGDILHVDNSKQTTTNGTFQQIDGRVPKIFDMAADMITNALEYILQELRTPIEYVYVAGNHDRDSGYYLAKTIETAFRKDKNITFDISPNPCKAKRYGRSLIGYCHGDMSNKNLGTWLMSNYRRDFGETDYAEIHCGHLHSKTEEIQNGIKVIHLPALCESSYWEHQQGYKSERALICYVWNEETGKRETWTTNF